MASTERRTERTIASVDDLDVVVDADGHTLEGVDNVLPYVDNEATRRTLERAERPLADVFTYTHTGPIIGQAYGRGEKTLVGDESEADQKRRDIADFGIDYSITTPTLHLMIHTVNNDRHALALARAYHEWALDQVVEDSDEFKLCLVAAAQQPDRAAEEIDRLGGRDDVAAVYLSPGYWKPLGNTYYDPIYEAAQDHDLPVLVHGLQMREGGFPVQANGAQTFAESHTLSLPFAIMWGMTSIMFEGVPERFPGLEFVFQEGGIAWVPWLRWRMDDHYLEYTNDVPYLERLPSEYIDDRFYFTTQPLGHTRDHPEYVPKVIEMAGPGNVMYSADLPHMDFDPPEELFDRIRGHFDDDVIRGIMGETAVEVFGLDA